MRQRNIHAPLPLRTHSLLAKDAKNGAPGLTVFSDEISDVIPNRAEGSVRNLLCCSRGGGLDATGKVVTRYADNIGDTLTEHRLIGSRVTASEFPGPFAFPANIPQTSRERYHSLKAFLPSK